MPFILGLRSVFVHASPENRPNVRNVRGPHAHQAVFKRPKRAYRIATGVRAELLMIASSL
jgi:hypothetical protein